MKRAALIFIFFFCATGHVTNGQTTAWLNAAEPATAEKVAMLSRIADKRRDERTLADNALRALKQLQGEVFVYNSLGAFEDGRALARVSFEDFDQHIKLATADMHNALALLPDSPLKSELRHALQSFLDGHYWWTKVHCSLVVNVNDGCLDENDRRSYGAGFLDTVPYTVAVNWRQANKHIKRAETLSQNQ